MHYYRMIRSRYLYAYFGHFKNIRRKIFFYYALLLPLKCKKQNKQQQHHPPPPPQQQQQQQQPESSTSNQKPIESSQALVWPSSRVSPTRPFTNIWLELGVYYMSLLICKVCFFFVHIIQNSRNLVQVLQSNSLIREVSRYEMVWWFMFYNPVPR